MFVHRSNCTEQLAEMLAAVVREPLPHPLAPESIVVQGRGMERWLAMELARRLGVWANPDICFPRELIGRALDAVPRASGSASDGPSLFTPEILTWSIAAALTELSARAEFAPLRAYLAGDEGGQRRIQLAERIGDLFDQYTVFRPDMILRWESGADSSWQAILWRVLSERGGSDHIASKVRKFFAAVERGALQLDDMPARICLFGISTLPPLFVQILAALSKRIPVHLFLLSPSDSYWAHLRSPRQQARADQTADDGASNPLLASLGRVGREFQEVIESHCDYSDRDEYRDPGGDTLLHRLQSDILHLRSSLPDAAALDPNDDSIRIHACHNPMREVEVLYDQLLELFAEGGKGESLAPHDVLVMSPSIDEYAPMIDAVFGADGAVPRIPYRIADRAVRATDEAISAFLTVLTLCRSRMAAAEVLDLLAFESIRARFGLLPEDGDALRGWVRDTGIRWGIDSEHRRRVGQPAKAENTWRFGLDRLLLGYAMPGEERRLFGGTLPFDDVEGSTAELVGKFVDLCQALFEVHDRLQQPRTMALWRADLSAALAQMIANNRNTAYQHQQILGALGDLEDHAERAGFGEEIDLATARSQLESLLERRAPGRNFLTGGVTFCAMVPMRSIPFKVICLLGLNDGAFPRARRPLGFDLIAQHPRVGDRSVRDDDRYLFLEAILSARRRLMITYVGQSIRDNSDIPPSVVVSELLDAIERSTAQDAPAPGQASQLDLFRGPNLAPPKPCSPIRHPLQPFSPRYFGTDQDRRLFSYSKIYCAGAAALLGEKRAPGPFLPTALAPAVIESRRVTLEQLIRFFDNPARALLRQRLSLHLGDDQETLEGREPIELDGLERWQIGDQLLRRALAGEQLDDLAIPVRAAGMLPIGNLGDHSFAELRHETELLVRLAGQFRGTDASEPVEIDLSIDGTQLVGTIDLLWPPHRLVCHFSQQQGRHLLALWLPHLVLSLERGPQITSVLVNRAKEGADIATLRPVTDAKSALSPLIDLYWRSQDRPLPLFRLASYAYARECESNEDKAMERARKELRTDFERDEYCNVLYANLPDPLATIAGEEELSFTSVARAVYLPILASTDFQSLVSDEGDT